MADLQISSLPKLASADLSATDPLVIVDLSASEDKQLTVQDMFAKALTSSIVSDNTVPGSKLLAASVNGDKLVDGSVDAKKLSPATVPISGGLLSDQNALRLVPPQAPIIKNPTTGVLYHADSGVVAGRHIATTVNKEGHVTSSGPLLASDLPTATATERGAVMPGAGLSMNGQLLQHINVASPQTISGIQFDENGHIKGAVALQPSDLPIATNVATGIVMPGQGLSMNGAAIGLLPPRGAELGGITPGTTMTVSPAGVLDQAITGVTGNHPKVGVDQYGRVVRGLTLDAADIPALDVSKLTTGELAKDRIGRNSISGYHLCDYSISWITQTRPKPEFAGQVWVNPVDRSTHIWLGTVDGGESVENGYWMSLGYGSAVEQNVRLGGTYDAANNIVMAVNQLGNEAGLIVGAPLPVPSTANNGIYVLVAESGLGVTPAPENQLGMGDWVLSLGVGTNWLHVAVISGAAGLVADESVLVDANQFTPPIPNCLNQEDANSQFWLYSQPASGVTRGTVKPSESILVDSAGVMTAGNIDDGLY